MKYPIVLTIAGSDSSGGAGIQADIKTASALGVYAASAITAITAQNTTGVFAIQGIDPQIVAAQIDAVFSDIRPDAVKIGMLFSREIIETVADRLSAHKPEHIVLDPVMISTSGSKLISDDAIASLTSKLIPLSSILTPNRHEAEHLSGMAITDAASMKQAASRIMKAGCPNVLIKGGHFEQETMTDFLFDPHESVVHFNGTFIDSRNTHGTGCTLSSAIASYLALGETLPEAVRKAKLFLQAALEAGSTIHAGQGHGPLNHFFNPQNMNVL